MKKSTQFTFVCTPSRAVTAITLLKQIGIKHAQNSSRRLFRLLPNDLDELENQEVVEVVGSCLETQMSELITLLSKEYIAGYSRETQVVFHPVEKSPVSKKQQSTRIEW